MQLAEVKINCNTLLFLIDLSLNLSFPMLLHEN